MPSTLMKERHTCRQLHSNRETLVFRTERMSISLFASHIMPLVENQELSRSVENLSGALFYWAGPIVLAYRTCYWQSNVDSTAYATHLVKNPSRASPQAPLHRNSIRGVHSTYRRR